MIKMDFINMMRIIKKLIFIYNIITYVKSRDNVIICYFELTNKIELLI